MALSFAIRAFGPLFLFSRRHCFLALSGSTPQKLLQSVASRIIVSDSLASRLIVATTQTLPLFTLLAL